MDMEGLRGRLDGVVPQVMVITKCKRYKLLFPICIYIVLTEQPPA